MENNFKNTLLNNIFQFYAFLDSMVIKKLRAVLKILKIFKLFDDLVIVRENLSFESHVAFNYGEQQ